MALLDHAPQHITVCCSYGYTAEDAGVEAAEPALKVHRSTALQPCMQATA